MVHRLMKDGHECVVFDREPAVVKQLTGEGAVVASDMDDFIAKLAHPRAVDAETTPLQNSKDYQYDIDVAEVWRRDNVVVSWLLDLTRALYNRFTSRGEMDFADKLLSEMRFQFGGHHEKPGNES